MADNKYTKPERIWMRSDPDYNEKWVQDLLADDPSILGLGDLVLRDRERSQPRAGRLDLLMQDPDTQRRYEVEIQLGPTDEAHIIRTVEYWDIERKRYPQYDHCAVLVAEDITSRFLNVVSLFNGAIPLIAIQLQALRVGTHVTVVCTTVVDEMTRGLVEEDEDAASAPTDRSYWERRATKTTVGLVDRMLVLLQGLDPSLKLKYNKFYIGLDKGCQAYNFVSFRPRKSQLNFELKLPQSDVLDTEIEKSGLDVLEYNKRWGLYRLRLSEEDINKNGAVLTDLARQAYERRVSL
jgi:hypothetical protein